jgi:beta-glucosidase
MVTLHHFSEPLWVAEMGGWENVAVIDLFVDFVRKTVEALKPYCNLWVTINEPNVFAVSAYLEGIFPPGKKDFDITMLVMQHLISAHAGAYRAIHELQSDARVGTSINYRGFKPASWLPWNHWTANVYHRLFNDLFPRTLKNGVFNTILKRIAIPEAIGTQDFLGLNYYTTDTIRFNPFARQELFSHRFFPDGARLSESEFIANIPGGMIDAVKWGETFGLPIFITENGVDDSIDSLRPRYILEHLHALWQVMNSNARVEGYFHWTLVDNFEWERGWSQRFGLWELDLENQARIKRPSGEMYAEICRTNGISSEIVEKYAPEVMKRLFP